MTVTPRVQIMTPPTGFIIGVSRIGDNLTNPATDTRAWLDLTLAVPSITVRRGHISHGLSGVDVGTLEVTFLLRNTGLQNPMIASPLARPGLPIRVLADDLTEDPLFTGVIKDVSFSTRDGDSYATVLAVDAVATLEATTLYGMRPPRTEFMSENIASFENFASRIERIAARTPTPFGPPPVKPAEVAGLLQAWQLVGSAPAGVAVNLFVTDPDSSDVYLEGTLTATTTASGTRTIPARTLGMSSTIHGLQPGWFASFTIRVYDSPGYEFTCSEEIVTYEKTSYPTGDVIYLVIAPRHASATINYTISETLTAAHPATLLDVRVQISGGPIHDLTLTDLGATVYESSAANHLTLAADTVGGAWFVDRAGITHATWGKSPMNPDGFVFSAESVQTPGTVSVSGLQSSYSTANIVNVLDVTNHAMMPPDTEDAGAAYDTAGSYHSAESVAIHGRRAMSVELNVSHTPHNDDTDIRAVAESILTKRSGLEYLPRSFRFRGHDHPAIARALDITQIITLKTDADDLVCRVQGITHHITPKTWLVDLAIEPLWR